MTDARTMRRRRLAATAVLLCALIVGLVVAAGPAAAETGDSAPIRPLSDGGYGFPDITGPQAPEEYPFLLEGLSPELRLRQIDEQEVVAEYIEGGFTAWAIEAEPAHDADGATVPTTVKLSEEDIVTLTVHYRAGNPAAGGAPFVFPIVGGKGWEGGWFYGTVEMNESKPPPATQTITSAPPIACSVPSLHDLTLHAAKARLRAADCSIGQVHLAAGATSGEGKVLKQFHPAGTQLAAGAPVAVKLGSR